MQGTKNSPQGETPMRLEGEYTFAAPRSAVWEALLDPSVLAGALPGGEQMERVGENDYQAAMNVKVGPVQGRFVGKITLTDITPLQQYTMKVDGQGAPGYVAGEGTLTLEDTAEGTLLRYGGDVQVGGRIAGVGQRLIESTARSMTRQGLAALGQMIQARLAPVAAPGEPGPAAAPVAAAAPRPAAAPSTAGMAAQVARDVARDLASDYIPPEKQERVVWFALGALAMLAFVVLVRLVQRD
jgi:carbon monoxide dehydrogenase subunit G